MIHRRTHPKVVVRMASPYHFTRLPVPLELIVLHTTQGHNRPGIVDLENLGTWFKNNPHKVASHVGVDDEGQSARYVGDARKCYHGGKFNSASLGIEQIGFAEQTAWKPEQLAETARWITRWSLQYGIPLRKGAVAQDGSVTRSGVLEHSDLGVAGGNHRDCGEPYPLPLVLDLAREFRERLEHPQFVRVLRRGDDGRPVKTFQAQMVDRGRSLAVDGDFGPATEKMVRYFQQEARLFVDGIIGPQTWDAAWEHPINR